MNKRLSERKLNERHSQGKLNERQILRRSEHKNRNFLLKRDESSKPSSIPSFSKQSSKENLKIPKSITPKKPISKNTIRVKVSKEKLSAERSNDTKKNLYFAKSKPSDYKPPVPKFFQTPEKNRDRNKSKRLLNLIDKKVEINNNLKSDPYLITKIENEIQKIEKDRLNEICYQKRLRLQSRDEIRQKQTQVY